jgi:hypothetical protein
MKTILLTFAALVLTAQTIDTYRLEVAKGYLTDDGRLNGAWWHFASAQERALYVKAWEDITGRKVRVRPRPPDSVYAAVADTLGSISEPKPQSHTGCAE